MANPFDPRAGQAEAPRPFAVGLERGAVAPIDQPYRPAEAPSAAPMSRHAAEWGLASLLGGGFLMVTAAVILVLNLIFWNAGPTVLSPADMRLALAAALVGVPAMLGLCIASLIVGVRAVQSAATRAQPAGLALVGALISAGALMLWTFAGADLLMILFSFVR
jgi:hypothetical protein